MFISFLLPQRLKGKQKNWLISNDKIILRVEIVDFDLVDIMRRYDLEHTTNLLTRVIVSKFC